MQIGVFTIAEIPALVLFTLVLRLIIDLDDSANLRPRSFVHH